MHGQLEGFGTRLFLFGGRSSFFAVQGGDFAVVDVGEGERGAFFERAQQGHDVVHRLVHLW
jgi:hypothetical protein